MIFALESPGFDSHTDILSLSSVLFFFFFFFYYYYYYCETTNTADENLDP